MNFILKRNCICQVLLLTMILVLNLQGCTGKVKGDKILFDFENDGELNMFSWKCYVLSSLSEVHTTHGKKSLKLELFPSAYPQLLTKDEKRDWRGYSSIDLDLYNPQESKVGIYIRIDDRKKFPDLGDRFSTFIYLFPGLNHISIPFKKMRTEGTGRPLDLKNIYRFFIFKDHPKEKIVLYVDTIRLRYRGNVND